MKPTLKPLGIKRLKLKYDEPLSIFGFKFNFCRSIEVLNQFNPIGEDMLSKQRYAAWRVGPHHILGGRHILFYLFTNVHRPPRHSRGEH